MRQLVTKPAFYALLSLWIVAGAMVALAKSEGKVPLTTKSNEALENYLTARTLIENLRGADAREYLQRAIELDPEFAMAHLQLASVQPSQALLLESLNRAKSFLGTVSPGEKSWILGFEAGIVEGDPVKQLSFYQEIVANYPNDERARNLLGTLYFGLQDFENAVSEFSRAIEINPEFAGVYNMLGYSYRSLNQFELAEKTFKKYTELIPNDPNPYDSYAELLMKLGRFEESIAQYRKALEVDPNFTFSYAGIASNLNFLGRNKEARKELGKMFEVAATRPQKRASLIGTADSYLDERNYDRSVITLDRLYEFDKSVADTASMAGALMLRGFAIIEKPGGGEEALKNFDASLALTMASSQPETVKELAQTGFLFSSGRAYEVMGEVDKAKENVDAYLKQATEKQNTAQIMAAHHLLGRIALRENNFDLAIEEMLQSNFQNPYHLYFIGTAYEANGEKDKALEYYNKVANFNGLNNGLQASVRLNAVDKVAKLSL